MKVFEIEKILDEKLKKINAMDWDNVRRRVKGT